MPCSRLAWAYLGNDVFRSHIAGGAAEGVGALAFVQHLHASRKVTAALTAQLWSGLA